MKHCIGIYVTTWKNRDASHLMCCYVPKVSYNLFSVSKATGARRVTTFDKRDCQVLEANRKLIATGGRVGNLYYLDCQIVSKSMQLGTKAKGQRTTSGIYVMGTWEYKACFADGSVIH